MCTNCVVIIPAYNEEDRIRETVNDAQKFGYDVMVVAGGSDLTAFYAYMTGAIVVEEKEKSGYGKAITNGMKIAMKRGYTHAIIMDIGTHDPKYLPYLFNQQADIVVGARRFSGISKRSILSRLAALSLSAAVGQTVRDATCGYRCYDLRKMLPVIDKLQTNGHATNLEILGLSIQFGLSVKYIPIEYKTDGNSQLKKKDIWEAIYTCLRLLSV